MRSGKGMAGEQTIARNGLVNFNQVHMVIGAAGPG
jgi:hypothetical protein